MVLGSDLAEVGLGVHDEAILVVRDDAGAVRGGVAERVQELLAMAAVWPRLLVNSA